MSKDKSPSLLSQKQITDKASGKITLFVAVSTHTFDKQDWISHKKLVEIGVSLDKLPLEFLLKKTLNPDENPKAKDGKAMKLSLLDDVYTMEIYTEKFGEIWKLSHTHQLEKKLFDAYVLVATNNVLVEKEESNKKTSQNFSLNLG